MQVLNLPGNGLGKTVACRTHSYYTPSDNIKVVSVFGGPGLVKHQLGPNTLPLTSNSHIPTPFVSSCWFENDGDEVTDFFLSIEMKQDKEEKEKERNNSEDVSKQILASLGATVVDNPSFIPDLKDLNELNNGDSSSVGVDLESVIFDQGYDLSGDLQNYITKSKNYMLGQFWKLYEEESGQTLNQQDARDAKKSNYDHFMPILKKYFEENGKGAVIKNSLGDDIEIGMIDQYYQNLSTKMKSDYRLSLKLIYNKTVADILVGMQERAFERVHGYIEEYFKEIEKQLIYTDNGQTVSCKVPDTLIDTLARIIVSFMVCMYKQEDFAEIDVNDLSYISSFYLRDEQLFKVLLPNSPEMIRIKEQLALGTVQIVGFYAGSGYGSVILSVNGYNYSAFYTPGLQNMLSYKGLPYIGVAEGGAPVAEGFDEPGNDRMITGLYKARFPSYMYGEYRDLVYCYVWPDGGRDTNSMREVFITKQSYLPTATLPMLTNRCFIDSMITFIYQCGKGGSLPGGISVDVIRALNTYLNNECVGLYGSISAKSDIVDMRPVVGQSIEDPFTKVFSDAHSTGSLIVTSTEVNGRRVISSLAFTTRMTGSRNVVYLLFNATKSIGNSTICEFAISEGERLKYHAAGILDLNKIKVHKTNDIYQEIGVLTDFMSEEVSENNFRL